MLRLLNAVYACMCEIKDKNHEEFTDETTHHQMVHARREETTQLIGYFTYEYKNR